MIILQNFIFIKNNPINIFSIYMKILMYSALKNSKFKSVQVVGQYYVNNHILVEFTVQKELFSGQIVFFFL